MLCTAAAARAGNVFAPPVRTFDGAALLATPGRVLVQFKPAAAATARTQARSPLRGLQLERLVGKHQRLAVGRAAAAAAGGGRQLAAASGDVPSDATMLFSITDGKSVDAKIKELRGNSGGVKSARSIRGLVGSTGTGATRVRGCMGADGVTRCWAGQ